MGIHISSGTGTPQHPLQRELEEGLCCYHNLTLDKWWKMDGGWISSIDNVFQELLCDNINYHIDCTGAMGSFMNNF